MYLLAKFGGHRSYRNGDMNYYINSFIITSEIPELSASFRHTERFFKSEILIYNSQVLDTAGRKMRLSRKTQAIAKPYAFHASAITRIQ